MMYRLRLKGTDLGEFTLDDLRTRREAGTLSGNEYVQAPGMTDWQPLDWVLRHGIQSVPTSTVVAQPERRGVSPWIWVIVAAGMVLSVAFFGYIGFHAAQTAQQARRVTPTPHAAAPEHSEAFAAASKPVVWPTNSLTADDVNQRTKAFLIRQWLEGCHLRGDQDSICQAEESRLIESWIYNKYGGGPTNLGDPEALGNRFVTHSNCSDPLALTVAAETCQELYEKTHRLERALEAYKLSKHKAFPRFAATVSLATLLQNDEQGPKLNTRAVELFRESFTDGSLTATDDEEIAEILVNDWGRQFFSANRRAIVGVVDQAGIDFHWLDLVLQGEREIIDAWEARGSGTVDTVTDAGMKGFGRHLAAARESLTEAWNMRTNAPIAPCRMIYVSLGDSGIDEMRLWFDRTIAAQLDYPGAWHNIRWGLRPRWYGDEESMLAFGIAAANTHRYDTDVPRKLVDVIMDIESEAGTKAGKHIYGRPDIWPHFQEMYEGYIQNASDGGFRRGWRSSYTTVAYLAKKYTVARAQLEALNWQPGSTATSGWGIDLSLMPLEVAARTGAASNQITRAELLRDRWKINEAAAIYKTAIALPGSDDRTKEFAKTRLAALELEQRLAGGEWVNFLPKDDDDPTWTVWRGKPKVLSDGSMEVQSGPGGHFIASNMRTGTFFEIKGEFDVVRSTTESFQAGIFMGLAEFESQNWYSFRIKHNPHEGDAVTYARGWGVRQIIENPLVDKHHNTFYFRFEHGKASATLNGNEIWNGVKPPAGISAEPAQFIVGIGAFNDSNDTVIRYRNLQIRRLGIASAKQ